MPQRLPKWFWSDIRPKQVLVITGPKCPYCAVVEKALNLLLPLYPHKQVFIVGPDPDAINRFNVQSFPTIVYTDKRGSFKKESGKTTLEKIREILSFSE